MINPEVRNPSPPEWWPLWQMELFYKQRFRMQCFIYYKYTLKWSKNYVKKYLFINSETAYYKYSREAKAIVKEAFKPE